MYLLSLFNTLYCYTHFVNSSRFYTFYFICEIISSDLEDLFQSLFHFSVYPPVLSLPPGGQVVSVREGGNADLVCLVDGKPPPPILWSRLEKDLLMPNKSSVIETPDGRLRLQNVSRDMMGVYRCQTAPYNGLNIKKREMNIQLNVQCKWKNSDIHLKYT